MKLKHIFATAIALAACGSINAQSAEELRIYINPGHGSWTSNDRPCRTIGRAAYSESNTDTTGFFESNTDLEKCLALLDKLHDYGLQYDPTLNQENDDPSRVGAALDMRNNLVMSRVKTGPYPTIKMGGDERYADSYNRSLPEIATEVEYNDFDMFISVHSNADTDGSTTNYLLFLFRGEDGRPEVENSDVMAECCRVYAIANEHMSWSTTSTNIRGDWDFYHSHSVSTNGCDGYLGVLKHHVPGFLVEGFFHTYQPARQRSMNWDVDRLEGVEYARGIADYFGLTKESTGDIYGIVRDDREKFTDNLYNPQSKSDDIYLPLNGAEVTLLKGDEVVATYTTDQEWNGAFVFPELEPGSYKVTVTHDGHYDAEGEAEVVAAETTYLKIWMSKIRNTPPEVVSYSPIWYEGDDPVLCNTSVTIEFSWDMDETTSEAAFSISPDVEGTFDWEDSNYLMVFTPTNAYTPNTIYTVHLAETAEHGGGMPLENPLEFSFMTDSRDYMTIIGQFPKDGDEMHYATSSNIEVRFDNTLNATPILDQISVVDSKGAEVSLNKRSLSYGKSTDDYGYFRIPFTSKLTIGENYVLTLSREIADKDGITLREDQVINFTAVDAGEEKSDTAIDTMNDATLYSYDESASTNVSSAKTAKDTSNALFDKACVTFSYEFLESEGSTVIWTRSEPAETEVTSADALGVHAYGDLSYNTLYAEMTSGSDVTDVTLCELDFLGWKYLEVPLSDLSSGSSYQLTGIKVVQNPGVMGKSGDLKLDNINLIKDGNTGIENVEISGGLTLYPNPASDYIIASADCAISRIDLISINGMIVKSTTNNILYVSDLANGIYIANVYTANGCKAQKVVISHK